MAQRVAYGSSGVNYRSSDDDGYKAPDIRSHHQETSAVSGMHLDGASDIDPLFDKNSDELNLETYKTEAEKLYKGAGIENLNEEKQKGFFDSVKTCYQNFFDGLSALGSDEKNPESTSIVAGMATAIAGASLFTMLLPTLNTVCSKFASVFNSSTDEVARTIFSGLCIISTGIRAAIPIAAEMASRAKNQEEIVIFSIATVVMASVYLATSSISVLLAGHSAILDSPTTAEIAQKLKTEIGEVTKKYPSKVAHESLRNITEMLKEWKARISANRFSLGKDFVLFGGAALSAFSAISKFVSSLAIPLPIPVITIITASISLVANVLEVGQGIVEYRSQKAKLESLRKELEKKTDPSKQKETAEKIGKLEKQLTLSGIRIAKGVLNVVVSAISIVLGVLVITSLLSQPGLLLASAILATISLASVLVLSIAGLVVRKMNNAGSAVPAKENADEIDTDATKETESEDESSGHRDFHRHFLNQEIEDLENHNSRSGHQNGNASGGQSQRDGAPIEYV